MVKNNLFSDPVPSGRKLEVLGRRRQRWKAQIKHMCLSERVNWIQIYPPTFHFDTVALKMAVGLLYVIKDLMDGLVLS